MNRNIERMQYYERQKIITGQECMNDFERLTNEGRSRRSILKSLGAAGVLMAASGTSLSPLNVFAGNESSSTAGMGKSGGKIKVASLSASTSDTLDPVKEPCQPTIPAISWSIMV